MNTKIKALIEAAGLVVESRDCDCANIDYTCSVCALSKALNDIDEVARVVDCHDTRQQDANARLIAAAPELLEALLALTKEVPLHKLNIRKDFSFINAHACALKAITKATKG